MLLILYALQLPSTRSAARKPMQFGLRIGSVHGFPNPIWTPKWTGKHFSSQNRAAIGLEIFSQPKTDSISHRKMFSDPICTPDRAGKIFQTQNGEQIGTDFIFQTKTHSTLHWNVFADPMRTR